jgi:hypothetical protein
MYSKVCSTSLSLVLVPIIIFGIKDAEECYSQLVNSLRDVEGLPGSATSSSKKFIEQYMMGQMRRESVSLIFITSCCLTLLKRKDSNAMKLRMSP